MSDASQHPLIGHLQRLAAQEDRGTLAALRRSLSDTHKIDALRVVLPFMPRDAPRWEEDAATLVAGLFTLHPEVADTTLPRALRVLQRDGSESIELRFRALLSAPRRDLDTHLRHAVSLIAATGGGIDWSDVLWTVGHWEHPDDDVRDRVRRRWAREYWTRDDEDPAAQEAQTLTKTHYAQETR
jgi:CRISPR type I-E-associated protein CasB/Cse2